MSKPRVVVCAAIRLNFRGIFPIVICGARHWDKSMGAPFEAIRNLHGSVVSEEQGFIDQFGTFMTREEAWVVAGDAGQIKYRVGGDQGRLFSENLY